MRKILLIIVAFCLIQITNAEEQYKENWESLSKHNEQADWLKDAKFGIYFHWGVYSVPAFVNEWYPSNMHYKGKREYKHHIEKYGKHSEFGYHDFVPMFKAEKFDAEAWAELFKKAGAKFAGPVAEHHDGFSMWASDITPWNVGSKGPKKDITGELEDAIKSRDMKFITTFHHARNLQRYKNEPPQKYYGKSHYPYVKGLPPTSEDAELKYLYGNIPEAQWLEEVWFGKLKEVINKYQPDIIWFDSWLDQIPEKYRQKFCAYYLNEAKKWDKEVVIIRKQDDLPLTCSIDDLEKSRMNKIKEQLWMTDETVSTGSWCYTENLKVKPAKDVLHVLIDIVSKNGVLLLNVSPKASGEIPQEQQKVLEQLGSWLDVHGQSIYGTRPWYTFGEGPTKEPDGHFKNHHKFLKIKYSHKDVRYTKKGNFLYVNFLGKVPNNYSTTLKAFAKENLPNPINIKKVKLIGSDEPIDWNLEGDGLHIKFPTKPQQEIATTLKIYIK
jgi:alpha-L-fucosidase